MVTGEHGAPLRTGPNSSAWAFARAVAVTLAIVLAAAVAGWLGVRYGWRTVALGAAALGAALLLRLRAFGVLLGLALLINLNGIPGFNANPTGNAVSHLQDLVAVALLVSLGYVVASGRVTRRSPLQRTLYLASFALATWWIVTWARTVTLDGVPATLAAKFARDFLYFALLLPLLCDVFVAFPRLRRQVLWTVGAGAIVYAVAQVAQSRGHVSLNFILHPQLFTVVQGTTRVYSPMNTLVRAGFALSCGALILASTPRLRRWAILLVAIFGAAMLGQLTRAAYFGAGAGLVVAGCIWWFRRGPTRFVARRRLIVIPLLVVGLLWVGALFSSGERHFLSNVATRTLAGYSDVNTTSGTVATRVNVGREMLQVLGQDWPIGVGFVHPAAHYYPSLPNGNIRDSDLGVLNALMLMGAVGAILVYLPLLLVLRGLIRASPLPESRDRGDEWLRLGVSIWIVAVIASSITLVDLFSFGGLQLTACILAVAASVVVSRSPASEAPSHLIPGDRPV